MTYGSVVRALRRYGRRGSHWASGRMVRRESIRFCSALLAHRYPDVANLGDFTAIRNSLQ